MASLGIAAAPAAGVTPDPAGGGADDAPPGQTESVTATAPEPLGGVGDVYLPFGPHSYWEVDGVALEHDTNHTYMVEQHTWPRTVEVIARPLEGVTLTGQTHWTFTFEEPTHLVIPEFPTASDQPGIDNDSFTIPTTEGVEYLRDGTVLAAGYHQVTSHDADGNAVVNITARLLDGYVLEHSAARTSWTLTFTSGLEEVTLDWGPMVDDVEGHEDDTYTIPTLEGIDFYVNGEYRAPGIHAFPHEPLLRYLSSALVTVRAQEGYYLHPGTTTSHEIYADPTREAPDPDFPTVDDQPGLDSDTVTIPDSEGTDFKILSYDRTEWIAIEAGTHNVVDVLGQDYYGNYELQISATPGRGYRYADTGSFEWGFMIDGAEWDYDPNPGLIEVFAPEPTIHDVEGAEDDTFTIPNIPGVQYLVNDVEYAPGTHPVPHPDPLIHNMHTTLSFAARALDGFILQNEWFETFFILYVDPLIESDWPVAPTFDDHPGIEDDTLTIPSTVGLDYYVDVHLGGYAYFQIQPGTHRVADLFTPDGEPVLLTVEARAAVGYRMPTDEADDRYFDVAYDGAVWEDPEVPTDPGGDEATVIDEETEPESVDAPGVDDDKLIIPAIEGVKYRIDVNDGLDGAFPDANIMVESGEVLVHQYASYPEEESYKILVMALADVGYEFADGRTWAYYEFTFSKLGETPAEPDDGDGDEGSGDGSPVVVTLPTVEPTDIDGKPGYLLPQFTGGFTWYVNGQTVEDLVDAGKAEFVPAPGGGMSVSATGGVYRITAEGLGVDIDGIVIAAVAEDGYVLSTAGGEPGQAVYLADSRAGAELEVPLFVDAFGTDGDIFTIPAIPGLVFTDQEGNVLEPGDHPVTADYVDGEATVILTVSAADGYRLEVDGQAVETAPGVSGTYPIALIFTDATAPVDDEDGGTEDQTDESGDNTGDGSEGSGQDEGGDQTGGDITIDGPGTDLDLELVADLTDDGTDSEDGDQADDTPGTTQTDSGESASDTAGARLPDSGAGGTATAALIAMALLMAGATILVARRTSQVR